MEMVEPFFEEVAGATVDEAVGSSLGGIARSLMVLIT